MAIVFDVILPVVILIGLGYGGARVGPLNDAAVRALSDTTFLIFMPGLLFGALARVDFASLSAGAALAYYAAALPLFAAVLLVQWWRGVTTNVAVVQSLGAVYANTVALGIPLVRLAFGEEGLAFLLTIIALHSLTFLTLGTLLIELGAGAPVAPAAPGAPAAAPGDEESTVKLASSGGAPVRPQPRPSPRP
ncbi:MAG: AEC family transporter, partial [Gammaproteobacteria bacterium]